MNARSPGESPEYLSLMNCTLKLVTFVRGKGSYLLGIGRGRDVHTRPSHTPFTTRCRVNPDHTYYLFHLILHLP